jgi:hypothetical protein
VAEKFTKPVLAAHLFETRDPLRFYESSECTVKKRFDEVASISQGPAQALLSEGALDANQVTSEQYMQK